ncbi:MAG: hypothetical protein ABL921_16635 [Pirellula sp.]
MMGRNEQKRQQKLVKKQRRSNELKKERNKKNNPSNRDLMLAAQRAPWSGCFLSSSDGMSCIFAVRQTRAGFAASVFLIDMYCLGVKNCFFIKDFDLATLREREDLRQVTPAYAVKLMHDGIAYARGIGFEPHPQTNFCSIIFGETNPTECADVFEFGKDGVPFYTSGPDDTREDQALVLQTLRKLGEGNYHYLLGMDRDGAYDRNRNYFRDNDSRLSDSGSEPELDTELDEEFDDKLDDGDWSDGDSDQELVESSEAIDSNTEKKESAIATPEF